MSNKEKENKMMNDVKGEVVAQNTNLTTSVSRFNKVLNEQEINELKVFLTQYIRRDKSSLKNIEDGIAIAMRAKDLNLPFTTCAEHIHVVNGKTGVDVHIAKALLTKGSVSWEKTKDYHALYEYTDGNNVYEESALPTDCIKVTNPKDAAIKNKAALENDENKIYVYPVRHYKDYSGNIYKEYQLDGRFKVVVSAAEAKAVAAQKLIPIFRIPNVPIDYVTEFEFTRYVGRTKMVSKSSFSYKDAQVADMFTKDTYKKYPKQMIAHRAWFYGARDIASDLLMGCMSVEEIKYVHNIELNDEDVVDIEEVE